ncbi:MAG: G5 domain-containing protein [Clostridium sp.]|nr:G5 domain-containing protein [Clostridium sp.]
MLKVNDDEKASISLKRILGICLIFLFISGICVFAANKQVKNVKITLSNGCEMNVVTSKTKVADILDEKHIILLPEEKVTPDENTTIGANGEIVITEKTAQEEVAEIVSNETEATTTEENKNELSMEMISQAYNPITEKTIVEVQSIPFETVTKNVANGASETKDQVLQEGKEGKKEVTYRVKYQNDVEIERTEISSVVLEEPVNKIVQVRAKQTTSRSSSSRTYISGSVAEYQAYARARCSAYGWSSADFNCLVALWNKESKWNPNAYNASSGAYGIPQALPASKMATAGTDYRTNYKTQINWGLSYISSRYGSPSAAWSHSKSTGWY